MKPTDVFGSLVFNDAVMQERLPKAVYKSLHETIANGKDIDPTVADVVASAMREWAVENGATHYTHWFQPMTGITAEKHDSFLAPDGNGGVILEFSGKELIKGEPDASSFPSGGLRATFEARGYTAWDPTSYAFIKENSLCIPTAFYSYSGEALDKKTPLLRSMEAVSDQAVKVLHLLGFNDVQRVTGTVGPEQEYFLIDRELAKQRKDIIFTGRTLFGAKAPKGQEMEDHYFGVIRPRVQAFMKELNEELWKLGIYAKTEHNEVAPAQHELAPVYTTMNLACDHNQLTMEIMKKVAEKHGLMCLLHEKPFAGVNGSGKHNNWSLSTDTGINLFAPGKTPERKRLFLLMVAAVVASVDEHQDLLRMSVASAGNDHRLGANEAPPAIVSVYLGDDLQLQLEAAAQGRDEQKHRETLATGVHVLPDFKKDTSDRNRTSPMAFTGNKFEFRMLGSENSIADTNIALNTIFAEALCSFAERLEKASDVAAEVQAILADTLKEHGRIIFNGNNYSEEWVAEAERRGLLNLRTTADAMHAFATEKNVALFKKFGVYNHSEVVSRKDIMLENYTKLIAIEANTMIDMAKTQIIPAGFAYGEALADYALKKKELGVQGKAETELLSRVSALTDEIAAKTEALEATLIDLYDNEHPSYYCRDTVIPAMNELRAAADQLEPLTAKEYQPFPTYADLLYSV
ncbi:MAG: glutamine synthetase III [Oscillospiraceae bacterium]|nr:glutamine synthetase III [Oscillospiraceae bacterium]